MHLPSNVVSQGLRCFQIQLARPSKVGSLAVQEVDDYILGGRGEFGPTTVRSHYSFLIFKVKICLPH
jgi:hypothetical protein